MMPAKQPELYPRAKAYIKAQKIGPSRDLRRIKTIVVHRLAVGSAVTGANYVQAPGDGRIVSWHFTVAENGQVYQHAPLSRTTWHCKYPAGTNVSSVGIEIYGPMDSPISAAAHQAVRELIEWLLTKLPGIGQICSHQWLDQQGPRKTKRDPGPQFDHRGTLGDLANSGISLRF